MAPGTGDSTALLAIECQSILDNIIAHSGPLEPQCSRLPARLFHALRHSNGGAAQSWGCYFSASAANSGCSQGDVVVSPASCCRGEPPAA
jgi:hypothetical protein